MNINPLEIMVDTFLRVAAYEAIRAATWFVTCGVLFTLTVLPWLLWSKRR